MPFVMVADSRSSTAYPVLKVEAGGFLCSARHGLPSWRWRSRTGSGHLYEGAIARPASPARLRGSPYYTEERRAEEYRSPARPSSGGSASLTSPSVSLLPSRTSEGPW